jgi:thioredoxin reductase (NADPH)
MVRDKCYLEGKRVVIAGGGDSAVDWAVNLCGVADKIYVVHRREKFRAAPESVARMEYMARQGLIELVIPYQLKSIEGQKGNLKKVIVCSPEGDEREIEADALLAFYGLASQTGPIERWGLELEDGRIVIDQASGETNLKGVYAAGDIATYPHKHKLILTGFAETVQAARSAFHLIYPEEELQPEHSTSRGNPGLA